MATINEALKKLFLGLGGDPDELKDNNTVSDYIDDLESAIETAASDASAELIDDEEASETKTYSSTKIESLIPENELPTPAAADIGKVVSVVTDGDEGAEYALETPSGGLPAVTSADNGKILEVINGEFEVVYPTNVKSLIIEGTVDNPTINFPSGFTRETFFSSLILQGGLKFDNCLYSANFFSSDYTKMASGNLVVTGLSYLYKGTGAALFLHGIVGDGMDSTGNTLLEVTAVIGQTNGNNDTVNLKPYTFPTT